MSDVIWLFTNGDIYVSHLACSGAAPS